LSFLPHHVGDRAGLQSNPGINLSLGAPLQVSIVGIDYISVRKVMSCQEGGTRQRKERYRGHIY
jgi:hypothetical protein